MNEEYSFLILQLTVFLTWAFILQQIGRFPALGKYIEMFGEVLKSFGFFLLTFISIFIAFALSFSILFPTVSCALNELIQLSKLIFNNFHSLFLFIFQSSAFSFFCYSMLKVFVMMVGEIDYQDMFYGDDDVMGPLLGHFLYAAFVFVVSIVLMNLVIGLTVKDIQVRI